MPQQPLWACSGYKLVRSRTLGSKSSRVSVSSVIIPPDSKLFQQKVILRSLYSLPLTINTPRPLTISIPYKRAYILRTTFSIRGFWVFIMRRRRHVSGSGRGKPAENPAETGCWRLIALEATTLGDARPRSPYQLSLSLVSLVWPGILGRHPGWLCRNHFGSASWLQEGSQLLQVNTK